jgi:hypothetical protein
MNGLKLSCAFELRRSAIFFTENPGGEELKMATLNSPAFADETSPALDPEVFDDDQTIAQSGRLAELLRLWNELVRAEMGTVQSFPFYDQTAQAQQRWHQRLVIIAATTGSLAVLFAIVKLARPSLFEPIHSAFEWGELAAAVLALVSVFVGLSVAFHTRWHLLRMKAEQYRFLKFQYLLHAAGWLKRPEHERRDELQTLLAGIHALEKSHAHHWSQGVFTLVDDDPAVINQADAPLADDIVRYFRVRRIRAQRDYFERQAHKRHEVERRTWMIPPACFFLSILCALAHFGGHTAHEFLHSDAVASDPATHEPTTPLKRILTAFMIGAAAFPIIGAMIRTIRTAFEFGRNANRFEGVARILKNVERQLDAADASSAVPPIKLELLREAEFVLQHENRSWMRLMIEAEWFG